MLIPNNLCIIIKVYNRSLSIFQKNIKFVIYTKLMSNIYKNKFLYTKIILFILIVHY